MPGRPTRSAATRESLADRRGVGCIQIRPDREGGGSAPTGCSGLRPSHTSSPVRTLLTARDFQAGRTWASSKPNGAAPPRASRLARKTVTNWSDSRGTGQNGKHVIRPCRSPVAWTNAKRLTPSPANARLRLCEDGDQRGVADSARPWAMPTNSAARSIAR